jgi:Zn-dependent peptidase ImmA (M78 family)
MYNDVRSAQKPTTESAQILVMRNSIVAGNTHRGVSPAEFRGFAVSDKLAPLVYINSSDSRAAQIFTLVHELAHLWIGQTGISNEPVAEIISNNTIENKCNQIATEVLVPRQRFIEIWSQARRTVWAVNRGQAASRWTGRSLTDLFLIAFSGFLFRDRY